VRSVAFSPDSKRLASGRHDGTIRLWDTVTGTELLTLKGHSGEVFSVAFSPDSKRLASGSLDATIKLWDTVTGKELLTLKGHSIFVTSIAFSPDGKRLASGSGDETIKIWDTLDWTKSPEQIDKPALDGHRTRIERAAATTRPEVGQRP
jgi:WD40 repeat protein